MGYAALTHPTGNLQASRLRYKDPAPPAPIPQGERGDDNARGGVDLMGYTALTHPAK